ncbi:MAG: hypothetical protein IJE68_00730 [Clostridia bacterium]|nr:hypothetical protein [Clostridia bacterium]
MAALKSDNSTLVELVLKLKPDLLAGGAELFKYAIKNCNFELLGELLWEPEISDNQELLNEGIRLAISLTRSEKYEVVDTLIQDSGDANVAVEELLKQDYPSVDAIIALLKLGAKAHFWPMHLDKHQRIAERLFKEGFGKSVEFSEVAKEQFLYTICRKNRPGVIRKVIQFRTDLVDELTKIAVNKGYTDVLRLLHEEMVITSIDEKLFRKTISGKQFVTAKCIVETGLYKLKTIDIVVATRYCSIQSLKFLIDTHSKEIKMQEGVVDTMMYAGAIRMACCTNRPDALYAFFDLGYKCDFEECIKIAAREGYIKIIDTLVKYAGTLNEASYDEAITCAKDNGHKNTFNRLLAYKRNYPDKFQ